MIRPLTPIADLEKAKAAAQRWADRSGRAQTVYATPNGFQFRLAARVLVDDGWVEATFIAPRGIIGQSD